MKLKSLHLRQFKQFRGELSIANFSAGINLFVGPNESGKSTLVEAIRAAFFERYKSGTMKEFQPWQDSSSAPEVELSFDSQGLHWHLIKRFVKQARCDLQVGGTHLSEDAAEERLAQLLGFAYAGRGSSRAEVQGIPGLLWVEQGDIQELNAPVSYAANHLQQALGQGLGNITSSDGDTISQQVKDLRNELLTAAGKPRGDYKQAQADCELAELALSELNAKVQAYQQQVDQLSSLLVQQRDDDAEQPWEQQQQLANAAQQKLADIAQLEEKQHQASGGAQQFERQSQLLRERLKDATQQQTLLAERDAARRQTEVDLTTCEGRKPALDRALEVANQTYKAAVDSAKVARQQGRRKALQAEEEVLNKRLARQREQLRDARQLKASIQELGREIRVNSLDPRDWDALKHCVADLQTLEIRREALATRLHYTLEPGQHIESGDETLNGTGEKLLLTDTQLLIPNVGQLTIRPGGKDTAELAREQKTLQARQHELCAALVITDIAAGKLRLEKCHNAERQQQQEEARLSGIAPQGVDDLADQCAADNAGLASLKEQLAELPVSQDDNCDEVSAETALEHAARLLKAAEQALQTYHTDVTAARIAKDNALKEWQSLQQRLTSEEYVAHQAQLQHDLTDANANRDTQQRAATALSLQIEESQPEQLKLDVERHRRSATALQSAAQERATRIVGLRASLDVLGAQGLEEKRDEKTQQLGALTRRCDELALRAQALEHLHQLLSEQRQALTRQLQAPLKKHLQRYLKLLFGDADIGINDALQPTTIERLRFGASEQGAIVELSFGAREQLGLIGRLAYADLLKEAGKPTLIILDDALVHTDAERLPQLKRILFDAAQRHQILLFSCHPDNWRDLGVEARDLDSFKVHAA